MKVRSTKLSWKRTSKRAAQSGMERERRRRYIADLRASNTARIAELERECDALAMQLGYADDESITLH